MYVQPCACGFPNRPEGGIRYPGAGVRGCEPPYMDLVLCKSDEFLASELSLQPPGAPTKMVPTTADIEMSQKSVKPTVQQLLLTLGMYYIQVQRKVRGRGCWGLGSKPLQPCTAFPYSLYGHSENTEKIANCTLDRLQKQGWGSYPLLHTKR